MSLFRIILFFFAIYFFRRVYQFYQFIKQQNQQLKELQRKNAGHTAETIDAEYKVID